jgi:hypothetical protein
MKARFLWKVAGKGIHTPESDSGLEVNSTHLHEAVEGLVDHGDQHTVHQKALHAAKPVLAGDALCCSDMQL